MKTATVTWITYNNFGTELQAYALQQFIQALGYSNSILSDKDVLRQHWSVLKEKKLSEQSPKAHSESTPVVPSFKRKLFALPLRLLRWFLRKRQARLLKPYTESQVLFEQFKKQQLQIDNDVLCSLLPELDQRYDCFICGSDQIWSPLPINFNGYYYLNFTKKPKIAYAPSFGMESLPNEQCSLIREWLLDYSGLSVRERINQDQLAALTRKDVSFVCDPTILFDSSFWSSFCASASLSYRKYLLCYFLESKRWYYEYAHQLASHLHLRLILVPNRKEHTAQKGCFRSGVGPPEFVSLIHGAEFVLTDSYHGSIFSVIFSKQFLCLKRFADDAPDNQNGRIFSLFNHLGLREVFVEEKTFEQCDLPTIDYCAVQKSVSTFRALSGDYLRRHLKECELPYSVEKSEG